MKNQNYSNHSRYYTPHHFVFYPLTLIIGVYCFYKGFKHPEIHENWWFFTITMLMMVFLAFMVRQHYGLKNQDRIIRLEMRLRYYILTNQNFQTKESQLTNGQIFALRFASDSELVALVDKAIQEKLSPKSIKELIQNWNPDYMRL
jgi:Ca2+/Na+ antiporter